MSDYGHGDHLAMMCDERRIATFRAALAAAIRPGDTVLDLGAGAGVMTFLALELGAAHVHAVDPSANLEVLRRVARAAGLAAFALTDHDTVAGVAEATRVGDALGVRVVPGCEFSVKAPWGEAVDVVVDQDVEMLLWPGMTLSASVELHAIGAPRDAGEQVGWLTLTLGEQEQRVPVKLARKLEAAGVLWRLTRT